MSHIERELLRRYLSGEASPEEAARVEAWLAEDADRWGGLAELADEGFEAALGPSAVERAGGKVWRRLRTDLGDGTELGELRRIRQPGGVPAFSYAAARWFIGVRVAAAVVLAVGVGSAMAVWLRSRHPTPPPARVAATGAGERATFRLPDGTRVMLGVASRLRYPAQFGAAAREVSVDGEAYFDVAHDADRPFTVQAGELVAKDLGTQFTVRRYPEDPGARVVVREGRVAIRAAADGALEGVVAAGQRGGLGRGGAPFVEAADTGRYFAWTHGRLVLDKVPLREALPELERWFDLEFRLADRALGDVPLSATLKTKPTADVLNSLAASLGMRQRQTGRTVTLYSVDAHR
jgi:ferric-dicitrate binding protein FerR (iron transport regulator)